MFFPHIISLIDHPNFAGMVGGIGGEAIYIKGGVVADDESGNLFKIVVFEDESGGQTFRIWII